MLAHGNRTVSATDETALPPHTLIQIDAMHSVIDDLNRKLQLVLVQSDSAKVADPKQGNASELSGALESVYRRLLILSQSISL